MISEYPKDQAVQLSDPLVSIIMIFFNAETFMAEAVESVLTQSYANWELLLVDDGSTDKSSGMAMEYASRYPEKVRYLEHAGHVNRGMSATRNLGIRAARGELISFIDADDVWEPNKLADQVRIMRDHPELGMVCGAVLYWGSWTGDHDFLIPTGHIFDRPVPQPEALLALYPLGKADAPCPSDVMIRANILARIGGFEEHFTGEKQAYEDQGCFSKLYLEAPVFFSSHVWLKYRQHRASCLTTVRREGQYGTVRLYYLSWLKRYLRSKGVTEPQIDEAIDRSMWRYAHPIIYGFLMFPYELLERVLRRVGKHHLLHGRKPFRPTGQSSRV
ncbi:glycosyltransferase family 2 protein [Bradyrhizobium yuanmingense]|uniref:glycosyltransferase family 2 protein n=1 Tax=Bradyrhizobium yuanmingense TaxID=108015 RepID=UPI0023B96F25|nr:glycosyltransferase family 2 protein [Bradyrhizobium yuanmingense]MDF0516840.1 glycosyltransferase family 2 protein [Bradyrhizobium yuanmingense]